MLLHACLARPRVAVEAIELCLIEVAEEANEGLAAEAGFRRHHPLHLERVAQPVRTDTPSDTTQGLRRGKEAVH